MLQKLKDKHEYDENLEKIKKEFEENDEDNYELWGLNKEFE